MMALALKIDDKRNICWAMYPKECDVNTDQGMKCFVCNCRNRCFFPNRWCIDHIIAWQNPLSWNRTEDIFHSKLCHNDHIKINEMQIMLFWNKDKLQLLWVAIDLDMAFPFYNTSRINKKIILRSRYYWAKWERQQKNNIDIGGRYQ